MAISERRGVRQRRGYMRLRAVSPRRRALHSATGSVRCGRSLAFQAEFARFFLLRYFSLGV